MSLGRFEQIDESILGLNMLTREERQDIITYDLHGDLTVNVICDYCNEALKRNPELSLANPLQ